MRGSSQMLAAALVAVACLSQAESAAAHEPAGPGMMGPGMMGPGMMGPGMMGGGPAGAGPMGPPWMMPYACPGMGAGWGMGGQAMGPGMMHHGWGAGAGPGRGPSGWGMMPPLRRDLSADDVRHMLGHRLSWMWADRYKLGEVAERDADTITAEILDAEDKLVQRLEIDRHSGWSRQVE